MRYPPLRYYLERVLRDRGGGISHWAAKGSALFVERAWATEERSYFVKSSWPEVQNCISSGGSFFTYSWSFLLTVKLLCLQSLKALIRRTFPL